MKRVNIESPYAGGLHLWTSIGQLQHVANVNYARRALGHSLDQGEAPFASHLLYTQPGVLQDLVPSERQKGLEAGDAWRKVADLTAFYIDRGWSTGMLRAKEICDELRLPYEERSIGDD